MILLKVKNNTYGVWKMVTPTVKNLVYIGSVDTDICKSEASPSQTQMISMGSSPRLLSKHM